MFMKDAFAPLAVVVPVFWLLCNRLWFEAAMAFCASLALLGAGTWAGAPQLAGIGSILVGIYVALEGGALKITAARRRGYADEMVVDARSVSEAEERYYLTRLPLRSPPSPVLAETPRLRQDRAPGAGLFALPGSH